MKIPYTYFHYVYFPVRSSKSYQKEKPRLRPLKP